MSVWLDSSIDVPAPRFPLEREWHAGAMTIAQSSEQFVPFEKLPRQLKERLQPIVNNCCAQTSATIFRLLRHTVPGGNGAVMAMLGPQKRHVIKPLSPDEHRAYQESTQELQRSCTQRSDARFSTGTHFQTCSMYDPQSCIGVFPFMPGIPFDEILADPSLSMSARVILCFEVAHLLRLVASSGLIHSDVKPPNILLEAETDGRRFTTALIDLGGCTDAASPSEDTRVNRFSPLFAPPERIDRNRNVVPLHTLQHPKATDVYSAGMTMLSILLGCQPAFNPHETATYPHKSSITAIEEWQIKADKQHTAFATAVSETIRRMIDPEPKQRGTIERAADELLSAITNNVAPANIENVLLEIAACTRVFMQARDTRWSVFQALNRTSSP